MLDKYLAASDGSLTVEDQLVEMGLAYVRFAHDYPVHFEIAFTVTRSQRVSLEQTPSGAYRRLYDLIVRGQRNGVIRFTADGGADAVAYLLWLLFHGMASLQLTQATGCRSVTS